jgi:hypothetical protein
MSTNNSTRHTMLRGQAASCDKILRQTPNRLHPPRVLLFLVHIEDLTDLTMHPFRLTCGLLFSATNNLITLKLMIEKDLIVDKIIFYIIEFR